MTADVSGEAHREPPQERRRLTTRVLQAAQEVLRAHRVQDDPTVARAEAELQAALGLVWDHVDRLRLEVGHDAVRLDGTVVLAREQDPEGLIDALEGAGITSLTLDPGVEDEEIRLVLRAVLATRSRPTAGGWGLLTSLFRADLHHFRYEADAPAADAATRAAREGPGRIQAARPRPGASPEAVRERVRQDASAPTGTGVVRLESFDSTLYFLDQREIEYLKSAIDREYAQDLALNVLTVLLDILEARSEPAVREEVTGVLADFLPALLADGRIEAVAHLVAGVREASRNAVERTDDQKERLDRLRVSVSSPGALAQLFEALERGAVAPTAHSMDILLRELRPQAIREVLTWAVSLSDLTTRKAVAEALDSFFTEWPHGLSRMLVAGESEVVHAGLELAGRLKLPEFADIVAEITTHRDPRIRRDVAHTLAAIGTAPALRHLLGMAHDNDRDVRIAVYGTFSARPTRGAAPALRRVLTESDLEAWGQREKRTLFEAFGSCAGAEGMEVLEPLLRGRNPFGRKPSPHTRACAAIALGIVGTPAARSALEGAARDRDPVVRSAVSAALRGEA